MIANRVKGRSAASTLRVPQMSIPDPANGLDEAINALVRAWNGQAHDPDAAIFFGTAVSGERQDLIARSLYRFADEHERQFVARWLVELAEAIYGGTFRWRE